MNRIFTQAAARTDSRHMIVETSVAQSVRIAVTIQRPLAMRSTICPAWPVTVS
jgi:hypothetical protein